MKSMTVDGRRAILSILAIAILISTVAVVAVDAETNADPMKSDATIDLSDGLSDAEKTELQKNGGSASYSTGNNTLTIDGIMFVTSAAVAIKTNDTLIIDVQGTCTIKSVQSGAENTYGVFAEKQLTINGTGILMVQSADITGETNDAVVTCGIYSKSNIYIDGATVESTGGDVTLTESYISATSVGLFAEIELNVSNEATVTSYGGNLDTDYKEIVSTNDYSVGIRCLGGLTVKDSTIEAHGMDSIMKGHDPRAHSYGIHSGGTTSFDNSVVNISCGSTEGTQAYSYGLFCYGGDLVINETTFTSVAGVASSSIGLICAMSSIYASTGDVLITKSKVDVSTREVEMKFSALDFRDGGICCNAKITIDSSDVKIKINDVNSDCAGMYTLFGIETIGSDFAIKDSNILIDCGYNDCKGGDSISSKSNIKAKVIKIVHSDVVAINGDTVGEGGCLSYPISGDNYVSITDGSHVFVWTGNMVGTISATEGIVAVAINILDSTVSAYSGSAIGSPYSGFSGSRGISNLKEMLIVDSFVTAVALDGGDTNPKSLYYGCHLMGNIVIQGSSFISEGKDGAFGDSSTIKIETDTKIFGSKSIENPVFEDVTGTDIREYVITRSVTDGDYTLISYDLNGMRGETPESEYAIIGFAYAPKVCEASQYGFRFAGWSDGERTYQPGETMIVGFGPITLKAVWEFDESKALPEYGWWVIGLVFIGLVIVGAVAVSRPRV